MTQPPPPWPPTQWQPPQPPQWQPPTPKSPEEKRRNNRQLLIILAVTFGLVILSIAASTGQSWIEANKSNKRCIEPTDDQVALVSEFLNQGNLRLVNTIAIDSYDYADELESTRFGATIMSGEDVRATFAEWKIDYQLDKLYPLNKAAESVMNNGETEMPELFSLFDAGSGPMLEKCVENRGKWYGWLLGP